MSHEARDAWLRLSREARLAAELGERTKELTALHETARIMQDERLPTEALLESVVSLLPNAFQSPQVTVARVTYGGIDVRSPGYDSGPWRMGVDFSTRDGRRGELAVVFLAAAEDNPFLPEERKLLESITDMIEVALDRRLAHDRLELAVSSTGLGVWEWDIESQRLVWSVELERIAGLAPHTFEGTYEAFLAQVHPDDVASLTSALRRAIEDRSGSDRTTFEYRFVHPDGTIRWVESVGRIFRDAAGLPVRWLGTVTDVSQRRRLEEELRHSQTMDAIGRLAGGVAHDFSNLLTIIVSNCEFMAMDAQHDPVALERLREILSAAESAAALTRQLTSFSRKSSLQPHAVDPVLFLERMAPLLRRLIGPDIELVTTIGDVGWIRVDTGHLERVLLNVAVNARDAMSGGGTLTIEVHDVELEADPGHHSGDVKPGAYVVWRVRDTGTGMSLETMARIFEPFFTTKPPGRGTGLGLATAFGIVRQSGGHITVDSTLGHGSTFNIYLPRSNAHVDVAEPGRRAGL